MWGSLACKGRRRFASDPPDPSPVGLRTDPGSTPTDAVSLPRQSWFLFSTLCVAACLPAQGKTKVEDQGIRVEMFESANLDRFLRAANNFLQKEDWDNAIKVLQEVIEGRTGEFTHEDPEGEKPEKKPEAGKKKAPKPDKSAAPLIDEENPAYSVFSSDDRIYRPVARLCHELLAAHARRTASRLYRARCTRSPGREARYRDARRTSNDVRGRGGGLQPATSSPSSAGRAMALAAGEHAHARGPACAPRSRPSTISCSTSTPATESAASRRAVSTSDLQLANDRSAARASASSARAHKILNERLIAGRPRTSPRPRSG